MTSKLVVNTIEADTGISSVSFASSISMSSTSKFHFSAAGIDIDADTNINRPAAGVLGFNINGAEKFRIDTNGHLNTSGIVTAANFKSGVTNVHNLGVTLTGGQLDVGSNIKLGNAGVITATSFVGSGANLTGLNSDLVNDTSPQLGGNLDCNNKNISLNDSTGVTNNRIKIGTNDDLHLWHNSSTGNSNISNYNGDLYIQGNNGSGTGVNQIRIQSNGAVELNYQGGQKLTTTNTGVQINGKLDFNGSGHLNGVNLGASQQLNLYHDTNDAYFDNNVGDFYIRNDGNSTSEVLKFQAKGNQNSIICTPNGSVDLHFSGTKKFQTVTGGVQVTGAYALAATSGNDPTIDNADGGQKRSLYFKTGGSARLIIQDDGHTRPASNNTYDLGTTGDRWRNIYTNDLNLSNKGSTNCVDNTWGDYTIQEGESDLFLINNRSGKKYKFNLTEVS